ncbi:DUF1746 domain-containing protein [Mycena sanguinolenta]|uniref:DUF1746 domain-containing protein n=1 Tax=Mycena sanguinolenta TaxID=230812 RepID=A0A8H7DK12_9AGAR|nr:DUF1746 domain-containing protein [Mycena sanguinolenta]
MVRSTRSSLAVIDSFQAFSYRELFFGGTTFCCCLRVRLGVMIMSVLGMLFAGLLAILLWFELSTSTGMSHEERAIFVVAGLVETFLFVASILGFVGAVVRKQLFVQIYAYFIYFHFILNLGVAIFLLYELIHVSTTDQVKACQDAIQNTGAQDQCTGIFKVGLGIYGAVAGVVLLVELYGAIIVARYLNQIQREKRNTRASRMSQGAFKMGPPAGGRYSTIKDQDHDDIPLRANYAPAHGQDEFDPYGEVAGPDYRGSSYSAYDGMPMSADLEHGHAKLDSVDSAHHENINNA